MLKYKKEGNLRKDYSRNLVLNAQSFKKIFWFSRGDILMLNYKVYGYGYSFTGICLSTSKKSLNSINSTFLVRNIVRKVSIEQALSLISIFCLRIWILDHARKKLCYRSSKLYYLRYKINQASKVIII